MKPLSLYIHIPFCERKCHYCDFLSFTGDWARQAQYIQGLIREIEAYSAYDKTYEVISIFIGGGTPSLLAPLQINRLLETVRRTFSLQKEVEITLEMNPGSADREKLRSYLESGINRLSIGLQSTEDKLLKDLGRVHNYEMFLETYNEARELGFDNINIDLIFGLPNQTLNQWENTLDQVISLTPEHLSCYGLIIEEGTPFYNWYHKGLIEGPEEEIERTMYHRAIGKLKEAGYDHYEISNFARPSKRCSHNITYWIGTDYLGLGLGASSYLEGQRFSNTRDIDNYIVNACAPEQLRRNRQWVTQSEQMEEFMFLGLRLIEGISTKDFEERFHRPIEAVYGVPIQNLTEQNLIQHTDDNIQLTEKGLDLSNYVFGHFML